MTQEEWELMCANRVSSICVYALANEVFQIKEQIRELASILREALEQLEESIK
jgi:hypothetical protein